jgi:hypothetical protein
MPGYRNKDVLPDLPNLPACESNADFKNGSIELTKTGKFLKTSKEARNKLDSCYSRCDVEVLCESWTYQIMQEKSAVNMFHNFSVLFNKSDYQPGFLSTIVINTLKSKIKVYEEQLAFGWNQLVGEIGGTWGLYLGLSFVSIFYFADIVITNCIFLFTH